MSGSRRTVTCKISAHLRKNHTDVFVRMKKPSFGTTKVYKEHFTLKEGTQSKAVCKHCNSEISFGNINRHLARVHGIGRSSFQDLTENYLCTNCGKTIKISKNVTKESARRKDEIIEKHKAGLCSELGLEHKCKNCGKEYKLRIRRVSI